MIANAVFYPWHYNLLVILHLTNEIHYWTKNIVYNSVSLALRYEYILYYHIPESTDGSALCTCGVCSWPWTCFFVYIDIALWNGVGLLMILTQGLATRLLQQSMDFLKEGLRKPFLCQTSLSCFLITMVSSNQRTKLYLIIEIIISNWEGSP